MRRELSQEEFSESNLCVFEPPHLLVLNPRTSSYNNPVIFQPILEIKIYLHDLEMFVMYWEKDWSKNQVGVGT